MSAALLASRGSGTVLLLRLALRRDRVMVPVWLGVLLLVDLASAASVPGLFPTEHDRVKAAEAINASPGVVALYGPILDVHSTGELAMTKMTVLYAVFVALMMLFVVRRHTRTDEEGGQAELIGGTAITGTHPLTAAVTFGAGIVLGLGVLAAALNTVAGLPLVGSLAFGASWTGVGLVAVGLTAVACQVSPSARSCAGIGCAAIGVLFVLRAVGDTTRASWLSWLTPFGWSTQLRAYSDTRWWVLLLYAATAVALVSAARALRTHRDLGSGLVPPRPGPATGSPRLADAITLSLRVHTPMLVGWTFAMAVTGLVFGAIAPSFDAFGSGGVQDMLQRVGGTGALRDTLLSAIISVLGLGATCFAVVVINHGSTDEHDGRTEQVLATATSRSREFLATTLVALGAVAWLLLVSGLALAVGVGNDTSHSFGRLVVSSLSQAPAAWTVTALGVLCYSFRSSWGLLGWGIVVLFGTLGQIGELLGLPQRVLDLSPYTHAPHMPLAQFDLVPAAVLVATSAVLLVVSWQRYCTRDIG